ncbi:damage-inducible protein, partial [Mesorhizobium sp. M7A.T.Ca.TU.009.01.3.1]
MSASTPNAAISDLRGRIARLEGGNARKRAVLPFGISSIDSHLPGGGVALGALHEVAG